MFFLCLSVSLHNLGLQEFIQQSQMVLLIATAHRDKFPLKYADKFSFVSAFRKVFS